MAKRLDKVSQRKAARAAERKYLLTMAIGAFGRILCSRLGMLPAVAGFGLLTDFFANFLSAALAIQEHT